MLTSQVVEEGTGVIDFRLERNIEYTLLGIANNSSILLYRGSVLMAAVGKGGDAGIFAGGGAGGGVNMAGENGDGKNGGQGGIRVARWIWFDRTVGIYSK